MSDIKELAARAIEKAVKTKWPYLAMAHVYRHELASPRIFKRVMDMRELYGLTFLIYEDCVPPLVYVIAKPKVVTNLMRIFFGIKGINKHKNGYWYVYREITTTITTADGVKRIIRKFKFDFEPEFCQQIERGTPHIQSLRLLTDYISEGGD